MSGYKDSSSRETKDQLRAKLLESEGERLDLEARVVALEKRFTRKHGYEDKEEPKPIDGISRNHRGEVIVPDDLPSREDRMAARKAQQEVDAKALEEARTEGLPPGYFRDGGLIRRKHDGRVASPQEVAEVAKAPSKPSRLTAHQKAILEHRAYNECIKNSKVAEKPEEKVDVFHAYDPITGETAYNEDID